MIRAYLQIVIESVSKFGLFHYKKWPNPPKVFLLNLPDPVAEAENLLSHVF
jgi:hypothetical protein